MSKDIKKPTGNSEPINIELNDLVEYTRWGVIKVGFVVKLFDDKIWVENHDNEERHTVKRTKVIASHKHLPPHINTFR